MVERLRSGGNIRKKMKTSTSLLALVGQIDYQISVHEIPHSPNRWLETAGDTIECRI